MINLLITGGCGFVGLNLLNLLSKTDIFNVRIVDDLSVGNISYLRELLIGKAYDLKVYENDASVPKLQKNEIQLFSIDICDRESAIKMSADMDFIVHLAANTGVLKSIEDPTADFEMNTRGTFNYLESAVANKVKGFIFASSSAPLGNREDFLNENMTHNPYSPYGASKMAGEGYCTAYYHSYSLETTILRFSNVYGCFSNHKNSVVAKFIKDIILNNKITIYGDGEQTRDFIHVKDLCRIIEKIIVKEYSKNINETNEINEINEKNEENRIYHIASGNSTSINYLAEKIISISGRDVIIDKKPYRKGEVISSSVDIGSIKRKFGFNPQILLEDGLKEVYNWFSRRRKEEF